MLAVAFSGTAVGQVLTWVKRVPAASPPGRMFHAMAYDEARQRTVLFGGYAGALLADLRETWEWDGKNWTPILWAVPTGGDDAVMAFDTSRNRSVWSGFASIPETWEWNGLAWTKIDALSFQGQEVRHGKHRLMGRSVHREPLWRSPVYRGHVTVVLTRRGQGSCSSERETEIQIDGHAAFEKHHHEAELLPSSSRANARQGIADVLGEGTFELVPASTR